MPDGEGLFFLFRFFKEAKDFLDGKFDQLVPEQLKIGLQHAYIDFQLVFKALGFAPEIGQVTDLHLR
jgi:hypothetical protein